MFFNHLKHVVEVGGLKPLRDSWLRLALHEYVIADVESTTQAMLTVLSLLLLITYPSVLLVDELVDLFLSSVPAQSHTFPSSLAVCPLGLSAMHPAAYAALGL